MNTTCCVERPIAADSPTERALAARIKRKLAHEAQYLHKTRPAYVAELGQYHITDHRNHVVGPHFTTLEELARKLGVPHRVKMIFPGNQSWSYTGVGAARAWKLWCASKPGEGRR